MTHFLTQHELDTVDTIIETLSQADTLTNKAIGSILSPFPTPLKSLALENFFKDQSTALRDRTTREMTHFQNLVELFLIPVQSKHLDVDTDTLTTELTTRTTYKHTHIFLASQNRTLDDILSIPFETLITLRTGLFDLTAHLIGADVQNHQPRLNALLPDVQQSPYPSNLRFIIAGASLKPKGIQHTTLRNNDQEQMPFATQSDLMRTLKSRRKRHLNGISFAHPIPLHWISNLWGEKHGVL